MRTLLFICTSLLLMQSPMNVFAVSCSYDPSFDIVVDELKMTSYCTPINNTASVVGPYTYHITTFLDNTTTTSPKNLFPFGVAPICIAFNYPQRFDESFSLYMEDVARVVAGGKELSKANLYTLDLKPTIHSSVTSWKVAMPSNVSGTWIALQDSLLAAGIPTYTQRITTPTPTDNISVFDDDAKLLNYLSKTPYSFGFVKFPLAMQKRLPCMYIRRPRFRDSDVLVTSRLHALEKDSYEITSLTHIGVRSASALVYPLVGPLVLHLIANYECHPATSAEGAAGGNPEDVFDMLLQSTKGRFGLAYVNAIQLPGRSINHLVAGLIERCNLGAVYEGGAVDEYVGIFPAMVQSYFTDNLKTVRVLPMGNDAFDKIANGKTRVVMVDSPPAEEVFLRHPSLRVFPLMAVSYGVVFNSGERDVVSHVFRCMLPAMFNGTIRYWDHPSIVESAPSLVLPHAPIKLVVRKSGSEANYVFTRGLAAIERKCNGYNGFQSIVVSDKFVYDPNIIPPSDVIVVDEEDDAADAIRSTQYSLGYVMSTILDSYSLSYFMIEDPVEDVHVTYKDVDSSIATSKVDETTSELQVDSSLAKVYPFISITYVAYESNLKLEDCSEQFTLAGFYEYLLTSDVVGNLILKFGFSQIPWTVRDYVFDRLHGGIQCNNELLFPPPAEVENHEQEMMMTVTVAVVVGCTIVALVVFGAVYLHRKRTTRDVGSAPKSSEKPFVIVFTDIESSTKLWSVAPLDMSDAIEQHHRLIRLLIVKHRMYEVKTIGDSFMVAGSDPVRAVEFAMDLQVLFHKTPWSQQITSSYREFMNMDKVVPVLNSSTSGVVETTPLTNSTLLKEDEESAQNWNGLRVRIGVHFGSGDVRYDDVSKGYDYYGNVVNTAARVEAVAHGGQVAVTQSVHDSMSAAQRERYIVTDLGAVNLRGVAEKVTLYQFLPQELKGRCFPPLRLDLSLTESQDQEDETTHYDDKTSASSATLSVIIEREIRHMNLPKDLTEKLRYVQHVNYGMLERLMSVMNEKERQKTISRLCERWGIREMSHFHDSLQLVALKIIKIESLPALTVPGQGLGGSGVLNQHDKRVSHPGRRGTVLSSSNDDVRNNALIMGKESAMLLSSVLQPGGSN